MAGSDLDRHETHLQREHRLNERVLEAYALTDEWLDLYGHRVRVEFERFLRPQIKFGSTDELVAELKHNVEETKELLGAE